MSETSRQALEAARLLFAGTCDFIAGATTLESLPSMFLPEVAFAGRSNVGKSSLINALTGRKTLARISRTPGRTQQINFFELGGRLTLVDLPGYGHAAVSKKLKLEWGQLILDYLKGRRSLSRILVLIDARHGLKDSDLAIADILDEAAQSYLFVLTKADLVKGAALARVEEEVLAAAKKKRAALQEVAVTSAETGLGIAELRAHLAALASPTRRR